MSAKANDYYQLILFKWIILTYNNYLYFYMYDIRKEYRIDARLIDSIIYESIIKFI